MSARKSLTVPGPEKSTAIKGRIVDTRGASESDILELADELEGNVDAFGLLAGAGVRVVEARRGSPGREDAGDGEHAVFDTHRFPDAVAAAERVDRVVPLAPEDRGALRPLDRPLARIVEEEREEPLALDLAVRSAVERIEPGEVLAPAEDDAVRRDRRRREERLARRIVGPHGLALRDVDADELAVLGHADVPVRRVMPGSAGADPDRRRTPG